MKSKIIKSLLSLTVVASYAYATEEYDCNTTVQYVCNNPGWYPVGLRDCTLGGTQINPGESYDDCVYSFGATGSNGCQDEAQTTCDYTEYITDCSGNITGPYNKSTPFTPTEINGPCS